MRSLAAGFPFFLFAIAALNTMLVLPLVSIQSGELGWKPWPEAYQGLFRLARFYLIREQQDIFRLSAELWCLLTILFMAAGTAAETWARRACTFSFHLLLLYKVYEAINLLLFGKQPNFYDDSGLVVGAFNLILDIRTAAWPLGILAAVIALAIFRYVNIRLFKSILRRFRSTRTSAAIWGLAAGWVFIAACTIWYNGRELLNKIAVHWITPRVFLNARESVDRYRHLRPVKAGPRVKYHDFTKLRLRNRPPVYFFMLESYGRFITEDPDVRADYRKRMLEYETRLRKRGLLTATHFSRAPIRGGRSWLSISSAFSGIRIDNQTVYNVFARRRKQIPHMTKVLREMGYETVGLQPSNRPRPGVPREDYYEFTMPVFYNDLSYKGPPYGWGIIPDQYSLFHTHHSRLANLNKPLFLFFMTVTSHAPWRMENLPPFVDDYRRLNQPAPPKPVRPEGLGKGVLRALRGHYQSARRDMNARRAARFVMYDMRVLMDYIQRHVPRNGLVIILGDHQPAFWSGVPRGDETPLHIISGDADFMKLLPEFGFSSGLSAHADRISPSRPALKHEGLFSLFMHLLIRRHGKTGTPVPAVRPAGLPVSVLRN